MDSQVAVKAVIRCGSEYLILREGDRWQAVGGRLDPGERLHEGLLRETAEETGITSLKVGTVVHVDEWFAKPEGEQKHIVALFYLCEVAEKTVRISEEHSSYRWISMQELEAFDEPIEPEIVTAIKRAASEE